MLEELSPTAILFDLSLGAEPCPFFPHLNDDFLCVQRLGNADFLHDFCIWYRINVEALIFFFSRDFPSEVRAIFVRYELNES